MGLIEQIRDGRCDLVSNSRRTGLRLRHAMRTGARHPVVRLLCDVSAIRHLLAQGETLDSFGQNLDLNGAALHGHWQLCQFLIESWSSPGGEGLDAETSSA